MKNTCFLSVVIPAYNEEQRLPNTLGSVTDYLKGCPWQWEVIVVSDGSTDGTAEVARQNDGTKVLCNQKNVGKAESVRRGVLAASGRLILMMDADHATPITELQKLVSKATMSDIVVSSRRLKDSEILTRPPLWRRFNSWLFRTITRRLIGLYMSDTQCGFKMFNAGVIEELFSTPFLGRYSFDVELLVRAKGHGLKIEEVPVQWRHRQGSKVRPVDLLQMYWELWLIKRKYGANNKSSHQD